MAHALFVLGLKNDWNIAVYASNDTPASLMDRYLPAANFFAFGRHKLRYTWAALKAGLKADVLILSHINLAVIGCLLYLLNPKCRIFLIAHGVEVWRPLNGWKKMLLRIASRVLCVSSFTRTQLIAMHAANPDRCVVLNNALDPFLPLPAVFTKPQFLLDRYGIMPGAKVVLTLTRIAATEHFKGYDQVMRAVAVLKKSWPDLVYLLAGPANVQEKMRLERLIAELRLQANVILTGFITEEELGPHFLVADLFVLPSKKEGFGIVFIEAMAFGLPVICGNADGSTDAVRNEEMGMAIDPDDQMALEAAMRKKLNRVPDEEERSALQALCLLYFKEEVYIDAIENLICNEKYKLQ